MATLHALTSLALSLVYLLPAFVLLALVGFASLWVLDFVAAQVPIWGVLVGAAFRDTLAEHLLTAAPLIVAACTLGARGACWVQRRRVGAAEGPAESAAESDPSGAGMTLVFRALLYLYGGDAWRAVFHSTVIGLWGLASGLAVLVLVALGMGIPLGVLAVAATLALGVSPAQVEWTGIIVVVLLSPAVIVLGLWLAHTAFRVEMAMTQALLIDTPEARARRRMKELRDTRLRMVDVAEAERRRIERDLHDGAQQRLLAVTMTLARVRARLARDPDLAGKLLEQAHTEAKDAMAELREVARGLHPRVLTDHGLASALPVAAGRCPLPVRVRADLAERPTPRTEGVAYYVACEALTNIVKHAEGATNVEIGAERARGAEGDMLRLTVRDDGRGGADPDGGTGLYGLWDRVHAVDGVLMVDSPEGGPTVLTAEIPWEA